MDVHPDKHWQVFVELEDVRAFWKKIITPVDENPLDLRQAFVAYTGGLGEGELKVRIGRQQMAFDLQRFVSIRDGPNVGLDHGVGHFRPLSITRQRHWLAYHFIAMRHEGLCQVF